MGNKEPPSFPTEYYEWQPGSLSLLNPIPCGLDSRIRDVCGAFAQLGEGERKAFSGSLSAGDFDKLRLFAMRSAVFALREKDADLLRHGLFALAMIEKEREDFRDLGIGLSLLYYTASRIGHDPDQLFATVAEIAEPGVAELITGFIHRQTKGAKPSAGMFIEVRTKFGAGFAETFFKRYEPRSDIISTAMNIGEVVDQDCYKTISIAVATGPPVAYLKTDNTNLLESLLERVRAGVIIRACLNPIKHTDAKDQLFTVFLLELEEPESAESLLQISLSNVSHRHARLAIAVDCLFCLVIARCFVHGVDSFEQGDSLNRFKAGIEEAMKKELNSPPLH